MSNYAPQPQVMPYHPWVDVRHRAGLMDYIRGASVSIWLLSTMIGFWWQRDWFAFMELHEDQALFKYFLGGFLVVSVAHLTLGWNRLIKCPYLMTSGMVMPKLLSLFFIILIILSPLSLLPVKSVQYAFVTWAALAVAWSIWQGDYEATRRVLVITSCVILAYLVLLTLHHGIQKEAVGGIKRNAFGRAVLVGFICAHFSRGWIRWAAFAVSGVLIVLVTSRGTMVGLGVFLIMFHFVNRGMGKVLAYGLLSAFIGLLLVLGFSKGQGRQNPVVEKVLKLSDTKRGVGTGFTGRVERWQEGLEHFWRRPLTGYGFRTRVNISANTRSAHSGYINMLLDCGLVATLLVILGFCWDGISRLLMVMRFRKQHRSMPMPAEFRETIRLNAIVVAVYATMAVFWVFEPLYLNLGTAYTILFFILINSPYLLRPTYNGFRAALPEELKRWGVT